MTDLDQLDIMRRAITALGLGQCAPEELVAAARTSESSREQTRRALSDANGRIKELEAKIASNVAEAAARDMRIAELERNLAAKTDMLKTIEGNYRWPDEQNTASQQACEDEKAARKKAAGMIADLERDITAKDASLKTANAGLARICEIVKAPTHVVPDVLATLTQNALNEVRMQVAGLELERSWAGEAAEAIGLALDDAGAPKAYHLADDTEREIPTPERIRLLGERVHTLRAQVREAADATNYLDALIEGHNALDSLNAPRLADGCVLSLAARVRSLPR